MKLPLHYVEWDIEMFHVFDATGEIVAFVIKREVAQDLVDYYNSEMVYENKSPSHIGPAKIISPFVQKLD